VLSLPDHPSVIEDLDLEEPGHDDERPHRSANRDEVEPEVAIATTTRAERRSHGLRRGSREFVGLDSHCC